MLGRLPFSFISAESEREKRMSNDRFRVQSGRSENGYLGYGERQLLAESCHGLTVNMQAAAYGRKTKDRCLGKRE